MKPHQICPISNSTGDTVFYAQLSKAIMLRKYANYNQYSIMLVRFAGHIKSRIGKLVLI